MLGYLAATPKEYREWAEEYYEEELDESVIEQVYQGKHLTPEIVATLNPKRDYEMVLEEINRKFPVR